MINLELYSSVLKQRYWVGGNFSKEAAPELQTQESRDKASYITYPNKKGKQAGLCQICYQVKNNNLAAPPNNPNYELGALKGSPCDTIGKFVGAELVVAPNPTSDILTLYVPYEADKNIAVALYNAQGAIVLQQRPTLNNMLQTTLSLKSLAKGVYLLKVQAGEKEWVQKVVRY